jgi:hypothetical protein
MYPARPFGFSKDPKSRHEIASLCNLSFITAPAGNLETSVMYLFKNIGLRFPSFQSQNNLLHSGALLQPSMSVFVTALAAHHRLFIVLSLSSGLLPQPLMIVIEFLDVMDVQAKYR